MEKNVDIPINNSEPKPDVKPVKKGPGRPRKQKAVTQIPRHGVTDTPHHQDDKMELVYDNPEMWKKIFVLLRICNKLNLCHLCYFMHIIIGIKL